MDVHKKRGIDATGTMATAAKPTAARKVSSDESEAALALAGLAVPASTRTPAAPVRETQAMRPIADSVETATDKAGFSHRKGDVPAGSPTVVAAAAAGIAAIGATPWAMPPLPAALAAAAAVPAVGRTSAKDEDQAFETGAASAAAVATAAT
ncbi:unnamed protein product [Ectocarpus sp. 13 AM-2016]